ncbi:hypothetical protein LCGC14_2984070 [marine sediment metagenome]|uniref:Uncharacterized protein n=1 Tax=marine sediment metagenome TaxID=412755 RepID=A0A0F8X6P5_9ZZZZ
MIDNTSTEEVPTYLNMGRSYNKGTASLNIIGMAPRTVVTWMKRMLKEGWVIVLQAGPPISAAPPAPPSVQ